MFNISMVIRTVGFKLPALPVARWISFQGLVKPFVVGHRSWLIIEPKVGKHKSDWQIVTRIKDPTSRNKAEKHQGFAGKKNDFCFSAKDATWQVFVQEIRKRKNKSQSLMLKKQRFRK